MTSTGRSSKQAARDRAALKRLRASGLYSGKIDLRKAPTRYQLKKIETLKTSRKAKSKTKPAPKPQPPRQKVPGATIKSREISHKQLKNLKEPKHKLTTYALPFLRKGQDEPEWHRFTYTGLRKFLADYKPDDPEGAAEWQSYAVAEQWTFDTAKDVTEKRRETNVYFTGVRIAEPKGKIRKKIKRSKKKAAKRKRGKK